MSTSEEISTMLKKVFTPIVLGFGITGNLVSMLIFSNKSLKKYTTFRLLFLLSFIDICVLLTGCSDILLKVYFNIDFRLLNEYTCKIHSFMVIFFTHSSSMLLLLMSVDRAIAISFVLRRNNQILTHLAKKSGAASSGAGASSSKRQHANTTRIVIAVFVLISLLNAHFLFFTHLIEISPDSGTAPGANGTTANLSSYAASNPEDSDIIVNRSAPKDLDTMPSPYSNDSTPKHLKFCYASVDTFYYDYLTVYFPWVDIFFYVMFPSFVMLICSIIIISRIIYSNDRMSSYGSKAFRKRNMRNKQISYLLLTTNFLFFFMVSPLLVLNAYRSIQNENSVVTTVVYLLAYSNHGFNFISYGISCEKYRIELVKILKKLLCWRHNQLDRMRTTELTCDGTRRLTVGL